MTMHALSLLLAAALPLTGYAQHAHGTHAGSDPPDAATSQHGDQHDGQHGDQPMSHKDHAPPTTQHGGEVDHPRTPRSPDYSDGLAPSHMPGHAGSANLGLLRFDRLEAFHGAHQRGQSWEMQAWYGGDLDRAVVRSEGERHAGIDAEGDLELLWSHAMAPFWNTELGVRRDFGPGPSRDWLVLGVAGLAPYLFEVRATAWLGSGGRSALRLSASYELRFTQRLILEPALEVHLYGKADPARGIDSGLDGVEAGLRLRYQLQRKFAPYIGVVWEHEGGHSRRQWVAGVRFWLP